MFPRIGAVVYFGFENAEIREDVRPGFQGKLNVGVLLFQSVRGAFLENPAALAHVITETNEKGFRVDLLLSAVLVHGKKLTDVR